MFIINISYITNLKLIDQHLEAHRLWLDKYYASGHFIISGAKNPRTGGIIIAKGNSLEQIQQIIAEDPFKIHQLAEYEIIEVNVSKKANYLENLLLN
jgi:uncharacterized protein YciI